jgi:Fur family zinc uptake transcriptional regulator
MATSQGRLPAPEPRLAINRPISPTATMPANHSATPSSVATQLSTAESLCQERGKRLTPIRRKVLEILLQQQRSLKAYELLDEVRRVQSGAVPPTIYRALDFLVEEGLVHRLDAINAWAACMDAAGTPHDLLVVCTRCGAVAELSDPVMSRRLAEKVAGAGFVLASHETELRALCRQCHSRDGPAPHSHAHTH